MTRISRALCVSASLALTLASPASASVPLPTISPLPGTLDASPPTQISFLGVPAKDLRSVSAVGSRSGRHSGRLAAYSTGEGASFLPSRRFVEGEQVSVHARIAAGASSQAVSTRFTVARRVDVAEYVKARSSASPLAAAQRFRSRPDLRPPLVTVTRSTPAAAAGEIFITPTRGTIQAGPMIFDPTGQLVWFKPLASGVAATNLQVQHLMGQPVLTWWQGRILSLGFGQGQNVVYDRSYRELGSVKAGNGYLADLHEFQITPRGTALLTIFDPVHANLAPVHGDRDGAVLDGVIQEIDIKTGLVMWEWHSLHHVSLADSYAKLSAGKPFDYFHVNSIDPSRPGVLLLSARNTWATYAVGRATGAVLWRLGGKASSFKIGSAAGTAYQHDARYQPDGTITLFDDGAYPQVHAQSRAVQIKLDYRHKTATLVHRDVRPSALTSGSQGNAQTLPGGDVFVGWGESPFFSEFDSSGALVFDAHISAPANSYRAFRFPWTGRPTNAPALAFARDARGAIIAYASYNGATDVASWQLLGGASAKMLAVLATVPRTGFETAIALAAPQPYVAVRALDAAGGQLGASVASKP